jgi:hypothetical protein
MDDVLKRLGAVESTVLEVRAEVTGIAKVLPHLATRADLKSEIGGVRAELGALRTDLGTIVGTLPLLATKADVADSESSMVKWTIGIIIAVAGLAFTIGKYGH